MAPALQITTKSRRCVVPFDELALLTRELRRLLTDAYPAAVNTAVILESAAAEEVTLPSVDFMPEEVGALSRALQGLEVEHGRLPDGLQCLWDGIRIDDGVI